MSLVTSVALLELQGTTHTLKIRCLQGQSLSGNNESKSRYNREVILHGTMIKRNKKVFFISTYEDAYTELYNKSW